MPSPIPVHLGAILIDETPRITQLLGFESEPYSGNWRLVRALSGFSLERKIRASGWNFFFMATEVKAIIIGALGAEKIQNALKADSTKGSRATFQFPRSNSHRCAAVSGAALRCRLSTLSAHPAELLPG